MHLDQLFLTDFRNYLNTEIAFPSSGVTLVRGNNGEGKTNLLEAIAFAASGRSFRASSLELLINTLADSSIVRGSGRNSDRDLLIESEINRRGRNRTQINKQPLKRSRSVEDSIAVTTFSPDDLELIKGGPSGRRSYLDNLVADCDERLRSVQNDYERVLRQRNTLLRQSGGRLSPEVAATLDVWDLRLAEYGEALSDARRSYIEKISPVVERSYQHISGVTSARATLALRTEWEIGGLQASLTDARKADVARGVTTIGPHRDEIDLCINQMPSRTHASQGEQRSFAIALRLASHEVVAEVRNSIPVLLLDDVFSELDLGRSERLLSALPKAQCFVASASGVPAGVEVECSLTIADGKVLG